MGATILKDLRDGMGTERRTETAAELVRNARDRAVLSTPEEGTRGGSWFDTQSADASVASSSANVPAFSESGCRRSFAGIFLDSGELSGGVELICG